MKYSECPKTIKRPSNSSILPSIQTDKARAAFPDNPEACQQKRCSKVSYNQVGIVNYRIINDHQAKSSSSPSETQIILQNERILNINQRRLFSESRKRIVGDNLCKPLCLCFIGLPEIRGALYPAKQSPRYYCNWLILAGRILMQLKQFTSCHSASGLQKLQARQRSLQAGQPFLHSSGHWPLADKSMPFESKTQHHRFGRDSLGFCSERLCKFVCFLFFVHTFRISRAPPASKVMSGEIVVRSAPGSCDISMHRSGRVFWRKYSESLYKMIFLHVELCQNMNKNWSNRLVP